MFPKAMKTSATCEWATPPEVFDPLDREFGPFDMDAAASRANKKAKAWYDGGIGGDGLAGLWNGRVWLNPPYGRAIAKWVEKAHTEVRLGRAALVVALLPARTETAWWHDWVQGKAEVRFLRGRVKFIGPNGGKKDAPFPSAIAIYRSMKAGSAASTKKL